MKTLITSLGVTALITISSVLPSQAITIDVITVGSTGTVGEAIFFGLDPQSTGTGVIDPFLRLQNNGVEFGVNTSAGTPYDDKAGIFTHDLAISSLATTTFNSVDYYSFALDVNQVANGNISLTTLKLFVSTTAINTEAGVVALVNSGVPVYDLGANRVDIAGNNGSGSGDMLMYIPQALVGTTGYLYLYSGFGASGFAANGGFEEWSAVTGNNQAVPDAGNTALLLGLVLVGLGVMGRRIPTVLKS